MREVDPDDLHQQAVVLMAVRMALAVTNRSPRQVRDRLVGTAILASLRNELDLGRRDHVEYEWCEGYRAGAGREYPGDPEPDVDPGPSL